MQDDNLGAAVKVADIVQDASGVWQSASTTAVVSFTKPNGRVYVLGYVNGVRPTKLGGASAPGERRSQLQVVRLSGIKGDKGDPGDVSLAQLNALPKGVIAKIEIGAKQIPAADVSTEVVRIPGVQFHAGRLYRIALRVRAVDAVSVAGGGGSMTIKVGNPTSLGAWVDAWVSLTTGPTGFAGGGTWEGLHVPGDAVSDVVASITLSRIGQVYSPLLYVEDVGLA
jgi:hypothetical protein